MSERKISPDHAVEMVSQLILNTSEYKSEDSNLPSSSLEVMGTWGFGVFIVFYLEQYDLDDAGDTEPVQVMTRTCGFIVKIFGYTSDTEKQR